MPDIKTRDTVKGTIKTLDKAAVAGERMKEAYVRTKEKAEHGVYSAESSPEEYAADRFSGGTETVTYEAAHQFDKQGRKGVQATRENISKAKEHFEQRKADAEQPNVGAGQHSPNAEQHGAVMEQRKADLPKSRPVKSGGSCPPSLCGYCPPVRETADREVQAIKTVERGEKTIKQSARSTGKATVKTTQNPLRLPSRRPERPSRPVRPRQRRRRNPPRRRQRHPTGRLRQPVKRQRQPQPVLRRRQKRLLRQ